MTVSWTPAPRLPSEPMLPTEDDYRVISEDMILAAVVDFGWPHEGRTDPALAWRAAREALDRWLEQGLPVRWEGGQRFFDFYEVLNHFRAAGLAGRDPVFLERTIANWRSFIAADMAVGQPPKTNGRHDPARITITLRREFDLGEQNPGPVRLRLPIPYADDSQTDIVLEVLEPTHEAAQITQWPGRLDVRFPNRLRHAAIEARMTVTAWQESYDLSRADPDPPAIGPEDEPYLRAQEGLIRVTPFVRELADRLTGAIREPAAVLTAFWESFFAGPTSGFLHHELLDPADKLADMLRSGVFDCFGGSSLLVALCRARGIPARLVHGIIPHELTPAFHFWAEVRIAPFGWVPVDVSSWDLAEGRLDCRPWSHLYLGRMDYRIKCQRFPHTVVGPIGIPIPARQTMSLTPTRDGTETTYYGIKPFRTLYRDRMTVNSLQRMP